MNIIIVDDELRSAENLRNLLNEYCPQLRIVALCDDPRLSIELINKLKPDVLFLDVEMPHANGFNVLSAVRASIRHVIFVTAFSHYAIPALREQALDYLLKPVDPQELMRAINRVYAVSQDQLEASLERIGRLEQQLRRTAIAQLAVQTVEGFALVSHDEIIMLEAESSYTHIHCVKKKYTVAKLLRSFEEQLTTAGFIRTHSSYIVNLKHVRSYQRGDGGYVIMSDGAAVEVSRSRKKELMRVLLGEE